MLLTSDFDAKITDFGTTRFVPRNERQMMTGGIGTLEVCTFEPGARSCVCTSTATHRDGFFLRWQTQFMAPEVMSHDVYTKKADVYSFAIGKLHPHHTQHKDKQRRAARRGRGGQCCGRC